MKPILDYKKLLLEIENQYHTTSSSGQTKFWILLNKFSRIEQIFQPFYQVVLIKETKLLCLLRIVKIWIFIPPIQIPAKKGKFKVFAKFGANESN
jgi:hypothetical protein